MARNEDAEDVTTQPAPLAPPRPPRAAAPAAAAAPAPKEPPPPKSPRAMPFLGTIVPANLHVAKIGRKPARLPIVVYAGEPQRLLGVAVVYDPSYLGDPLVAQLEAEGYQGPFSLASVGGLSVGEKHAAAVAIDTAEDPDLNVAETLATFGYDVKRARR